MCLQNVLGKAEVHLPPHILVFDLSKQNKRDESAKSKQIQNTTYSNQ